MLNKKKTKVLISFAILAIIIFSFIVTPHSPAPEVIDLYFLNDENVSRSKELNENNVIKMHIIEDMQSGFYLYSIFVYNNVTHTIRLSEALQRYTYNAALYYGVDYELILSIIGCESGWDVNEKGNGHYIGLGMISKVALPELKKAIGTRNLADPRQNIEAICYLMSQKFKENDNDESAALMSYNHGQAGAEVLFARGVDATKYSKKVLGFKNALEKIKKQVIMIGVNHRY